MWIKYMYIPTCAAENCLRILSSFVITSFNDALVMIWKMM